MINLDSTADLLKLTTGSAGAIDVSVSWVDMDATALASPTFDPKLTITPQITTATTTTILASPAGSHRSNAKQIAIRNAHATVANAVTPTIYDGTTNATIVSYTLYAGDQLHYDDLTGWKYIPSSNTIQVPGRFLSATALTTGTTYTTGALTNTIQIVECGGGGGGGGCTSVAADASAAGGGGAGGVGEKTFAVSPSTGYTYAIGAAGTGVSGAGGNDGGDTTFAVGATTVTAKRGTGAVVGTAVATASVYAGGAGGVAGTNGDVNSPGQPGQFGYNPGVGSFTGGSGNGGSSPFGGGGLGLVAVGNGNAATGNGAGGGGAATGASAARTGGDGTKGILVVYEFS